jgi:hypothetical protein
MTEFAKDPRSSARYCASTGGRALLILALATTIGCRQPRSSEGITRQQESRQISSNEIWARFKENNFGAQAEYAGVNLIVTGTAAGVELEGAGRPVLLLQSPDDHFPVRAELSPDAGAKVDALQDGTRQVLHCQGVTELAGAPMLLNCEL